MTMEHTCTAVWDPREAARLGYGAVALRYMRLGYAVLGTRPGVKIPHQAYGDEGGYKWATTDERMVPWLWERDRFAGVAIATGTVSDLMVIDIDVKGQHNGTASFTGLLNAQGWRLPPVPQVTTPSGGYHLWLRLPRSYDGGGRPWKMEIPTRPGILPGVDIKGAGGYVLAPPSQARVDSMVRSDGSLGGVLLPYRWSGGCACEVPEAPWWLYQWIMTAQATGSPHGGAGEPVPDVSELVAGGGLAPGSRNITLHRLACSLFRRYGTRPAGIGQARAQLDAVMAASDLNGFSHGERERTIRSALEWATAREAEDFEAGEAFSR
jgi:hypothetical protein